MHEANGVKSRIWHALLANGFGQVVSIFCQLAGVPLFLCFWGAERYGEWIILSAIPAYLAMSDMGFASASANDMAMNTAKGERDLALKTFHSTAVVILLAAVLSGVVVMGAVAIHLHHGLLPVQKAPPAEVGAVMLILWLQVIAAQFNGQISAAYRCDGHFAIGTFYANLLRLAEFVATAAALLMGGGFVALALAMLAVRVLGIFWLRVDLLRRSPWLSMGVSRASRHEIKRLMRPAFAFMAFPLGNAISMQGYILLVGSFMGGAAVSLFSIHRTLTRVPLQMMGVINASVWPELSRAFGRGDVNQVRQLHRLSVGASFWSVTLALLSLVFISEPLMAIWTAGKVHAQADLMLVLGLVILANSLWFTSSVVAASSNQHESIALTYLITSVLALVVAMPFGKLHSLTGIAASLMVIDVGMVFFVLRQSMRLTQDRPIDFAVSILGFPKTALQTAKGRIARFKAALL